MHNFKNFMGELSVLFGYPKNLIILFIRLVLAYGFLMPGLIKINNLEDTTKWFESVNIPLAEFTAHIVSGIEVVGMFLLVLGLFTRYISFLLGSVMLGAMIFVHAPYGFNASENGIELPLYYFLFLVFLSAFGAGKYSIDRLFLKDK